MTKDEFVRSLLSATAESVYDAKRLKHLIAPLTGPGLHMTTYECPECRKPFRGPHCPRCHPELTRGRLPL